MNTHLRRLTAVMTALVPALALLAPMAGETKEFTVTRFSIGGDGGTDYLTAEPGTGRVFVTRGTHVMVVDGDTGKVLGDIPDTPGVHGVALVPKWNHGFTTNRQDATLTVFDLKTLAVVRKASIPSMGLDGILYEASMDRIILSNHGRPVGTAMAVNPDTGEVLATTNTEDAAPEGVASDGKGQLYINNEGKSTVQVIDAKSMTVKASWPLQPCEGPTGIAYDQQNARLFVGCSKASMVLDPATGRIVATIPNGDGVDALGWDPGEKLLYIPAGRDGTVTIAHEDTPDKYSVVATVTTIKGAKTIAVDPKRHVAYEFQPEYGPLPPPTADAPAPTGPAARFARGPIIGTWFFAIHH
jgi:DNA-binding beta-propeller fold protein YncE